MKEFDPGKERHAIFPFSASLLLLCILFLNIYLNPRAGWDAEKQIKKKRIERKRTKQRDLHDLRYSMYTAIVAGSRIHCEFFFFLYTITYMSDFGFSQQLHF